jgi:endoglycosylceramidase
MQKALTAQGIEVLSFFIDATVPGLYYSYSTRVAVNWMSFARRHAESTLDPFVWSIRSLGTLHLGNQHQDENKIASSRSMYGRALRGLHDLLQNPRSVRSDMTLAIAVMLGFFEMLDGMTTESWLTHSRGISTLFRLRGPEAHRSGFGRTLLVSFKSFIVADALVRGESCFLAEPQWRSVLSQTIIDENARGKGCRLGDLSEQIFVEVTECPGLYARTCGVIRDREPDSAVRQTLLDEIVLCKRRLQSLREDLESEFPAPLEDRVLKTKADLIALIPVAVAQKLRQFALHGAESALALLDQMIVLVQADARRLSMAPTVSTLPSWDVVPAPSMAPFVPMRTKERLSNRLPAWPDQLALSMGMLAMKDGLPG